MSFAMLEMRVVIRGLLRARDVRAAVPAHEPPRRRNISVFPAAGSRVELPAHEVRAPVAA
jgi:cytochrome P450